ncbi:MAG: class I SAM-dependent methyltransferase [Phycisphaerales bacterium]|nr:MAG: class I SAM-dependent methyltransferase [Phycisphaerales bacterium]
MEEYDESSAAFYDYYATGLEGELEFYVEEARQAGGPVLELGCGTGRILIPVAQAEVPVTGLDQSEAMLKVARHKISFCDDQVQERIELIQGDMGDFSLGKRFKLIIIPFRSFLHLLTPEDQRHALNCIREHLLDDGKLVFNIFDPNLDMIAGHFGAVGTALKHQTEFVHPATDRRVIVWDTRRYEREHQMIDQYWVFEELDDDGQVVSKRYSRMTLRYVFRYEMQHLLELCGFHIEALLGDFNKGPYQHGGEQIWVARRS